MSLIFVWSLDELAAVSAVVSISYSTRGASTDTPSHRLTHTHTHTRTTLVRTPTHTQRSVISLQFAGRFSLDAIITVSHAVLSSPYIRRLKDVNKARTGSSVPRVAGPGDGACTECVLSATPAKRRGGLDDKF